MVGLQQMMERTATLQPITKYAWDQSEKFVSIYIDWPDAANRISSSTSCDFGDGSFDLVIQDGPGYGLRLQTAGELEPTKCKVTVKAAKVVVKLAKKSPATWPALKATVQDENPSNGGGAANLAKMLQEMGAARDRQPDPFDMDDGWDPYGDEPPFESSTPLDLSIANWESCQYLASFSGNSHYPQQPEALAETLLLRAERLLPVYNHRAALSCAMSAAALCPHDLTMLVRAKVIMMICSHQLNDRDAAVRLRSEVIRMDAGLGAIERFLQCVRGDPTMQLKPGALDTVAESVSGHLSPYLRRRFAGCSEVLDLVPELLRQAREYSQAQKLDRAGR